MVRRVDLRHLLGEHLHGSFAAVGDRGLELPLHQRKRFSVVTGRRELVVEQLKSRLELRGGGAAGNAVRRQRDVRTG